MKRPTFFISSTIYDFADLRSALKHFLEAQGCRVLASECNDFPIDRAVHSYQACLKTIEDADYFILLIGTRVGGWYDEPGRISITQSEYRRARELQDAGRLKLLNFVRSSVWTVREDRRELARFLKDIPLDPATARAIAAHPGKLAEDADFLARFIDEVARNAETKAATRGERPAPSGNWVHVFSAFKDIIDVLQSQLFLATPMDELSMRSVLRIELRELLAQCLLKVEGEALSPRSFLERFHATYPIHMPDRAGETFSVATKDWTMLSSLSIHLLGRRLTTLMLGQAVASPTFLAFDRERERYVATPVYRALATLHEQVAAFNRACTTENLSVVFGHSKRARPNLGPVIDIPTHQLVGLLHLHDRWANVISLCEALIVHFEGAPWHAPSLRPDSPVQGMQADLDKERVKDAELSAYLAVRAAPPKAAPKKRTPAAPRAKE